MTIIAYFISITLMLLIPLALAILLRRRLATPWWLFCVGMGTFVASQLVHFPLNDWLADLGLLQLGVNLQGRTLLQTALVLGLTAGASETAARAVGYWLLFRYDKAPRREDGIMVGLGHGGIEAMLFGAVLTAATLSSLWALRDTDLTSLGLSSEQLAALTQQMSLLTASPWQALAGPLERLIAIVVHVALSLLVWRAFRRRNPLYVVVAFLYHALVDFTAAYMAYRFGAANQGLAVNPWLLELAFLGAALPGLAWIAYEWRSRPDTAPPAAKGAAEEVRLFAVTLQKELLQQWRTKRVLVVAAIFALFGLMSPLLAYFTPELLRTLEGAEQFADLIPTPTTADALGQYVKNLTQFGFIIAVLLGMGAIAGEKEKGTTAMILSKPLPRWTFVLSKFAAQALVYLLGFVLAAAGAYFYTEYLFGGLALAPFLLGNVLLLVWLLTFAAVTLLGSAVARSTGAAAAVAMGGSVLLLLSGSLPRIGALAPSGLVSWAGQLGLESSVTPNGGALVANVVIVVVCLLLSVAVFETQEL